MNWYVHITVIVFFLHVFVDMVCVYVCVCVALCVCVHVRYTGVLSLPLHTSPMT